MAISKAPRPHIYLFHGRDDFVASSQIEKIRRFIPDPWWPHVRRTFYGHDLREAELLTEVATLPFGYPYKLLIVKQYNKLKPSTVLQILKGCTDSCFLLLFQDELKPPPTAIKTWIAKHPQRVVLRQCYPPNLAALENRITSYLKERDLSFTSNAVKHLAAYLEKHPELFKSEIEKIETYLFSTKESLSEDIVQAMLSVGESGDIYRLCDSILSRRKKASCQDFLSFLKNSGQLIFLQAVLLGEFYKLLQYQELSGSNLDERQIFNQMGIRYGLFQKAVRERASRFHTEEVLRFLIYIQELEVLLKTENLTPEAAGKTKVNLMARHYLMKFISLCCR